MMSSTPDPVPAGASETLSPGTRRAPSARRGARGRSEVRARDQRARSRPPRARVPASRVAGATSAGGGGVVLLEPAGGAAGAIQDLPQPGGLGAPSGKHSGPGLLTPAPPRTGQHQ